MFEKSLFWVTVISCVGFWVLVLSSWGEKMYYRIMNYMLEEVVVKKVEGKPEEEKEE